MSLLIGLLSSGVVGTIIFVILLATRPVSKRIFSKTWHYYSLVVPLVFLLGGTLLAGALASNVQDFRAARTPMPVSESIYIRLPQSVFTMPETSVSTVFSPPPMQEMPLETVPARRSSFASWLLLRLTSVVPYIVFCWAMGAILFIGISTKKYLKYRRLVLSHAAPCLDIVCKLPVVVSDIAHTPMLIGIVKPVIVLPNMLLAGAALEVILAHEMVHHRRKDLLYKMFGFAANVIHWYNPLVYVLNRQLNTLCELSCDEKVASTMDAPNRKLYGETILHVLNHSAQQKRMVSNVIFATNLCNSAKNIKRRLVSMMAVKKMKKHVVVCSLMAVAVVFAVGFFVSHRVDFRLPAYAAEEADAAAVIEESPEMPVVVENVENVEPVHVVDIPTTYGLCEYPTEIESPYVIARTLDEVWETIESGLIPVTDLDVWEIRGQRMNGIIIMEQCLYEALDVLNEAYKRDMAHNPEEAGPIYNLVTTYIRFCEWTDEDFAAWEHHRATRTRNHVDFRFELWNAALAYGLVDESEGITVDIFDLLNDESLRVFAEYGYDDENWPSDAHVSEIVHRLFGAHTIPIYQDGQVVGFETTENSVTHTVSFVPLVFADDSELPSAIYQSMGGIMWPTYIPAGFTLAEIGTNNPRNDARFAGLFTDGDYSHLNELMAVFTNGENNIMLSIQFFQPYTPFGTPNTSPPLSHEEPVVVNGMHGVLCRLGDGFSPTLILWDSSEGNPQAWEIANGVQYQIMACSVPEETLIRIGESLSHLRTAS